MIFTDWECEKLNIKFGKYILGVNKKTTNLAVLAKLGKFSIYISIVTSICMDWHRVQNKPSNLLKAAYEECKNMYDDHLVSWFSTIMALANKLQIDLSVVKNWGEKKFKIHVKNCLRQNFLEYWQQKKTSGLVLIRDSSAVRRLSGADPGFGIRGGVSRRGIWGPLKVPIGSREEP